MYLHATIREVDGLDEATCYSLEEFVGDDLRRHRYPVDKVTNDLETEYASVSCSSRLATNIIRIRIEPVGMLYLYTGSKSNSVYSQIKE